MHSKRYDVPRLDRLPVFEAAARNLSFTKAGEELFLTQSAVSRQILALEESLGVKLFQRRPRALLLTENGQMLYFVAQDVLQKLHDSARKLRGVSKVRTVTLATTPGFASLWLIPRLTRFTRGHPTVDVRISAANELINLQDGDIDLAIRYCPPKLARGGKRLFGDKVFPVCSPALATDPARPLSEPADLCRHTLLELDDPNNIWLDWNPWFNALGLENFQPGGKLHFSNYDQLIHAAISGQGVALGRDPLLRQLLQEGRLVAPFKESVASPRAFFLIESATSATKPDVRDFVAWLLSETKQETLPGSRKAARR